MPEGGSNTRAGSAASRGYDAAWRRLRRIILANEPLCRYCAEVGVTTLAAHVDHIVPISQRPDLRLDPANLQPLCEYHHNVVKAREEYWGEPIGYDADGNPRER